jgi:hypothetical protein
VGDIYWSSNPRTSDCDLIWKQGLNGSNPAKMESLESPHPMTGALIQRGNLDTEKDTRKIKAM